MQNFISLIIYLSSILFPSLFTFYFYKKRKKKISKKREIIIILLIAIIPILVVGCRYYVGTDYESYQYLFKIYSQKNFFEILFDFDRYEPGIRIMLALTKSDVTGRLFFIAFSTFTYGISMYTIIHSKYIENKPIAVFVFLILYLAPSCNIIRQCIAIPILMLSINYIFEKKKFKFFLLVLLATLFHYYAIVFLPMYLLFDDNNKIFEKKKYRFYILLISIPIFIYAVLSILCILNIDIGILKLKEFDISWLTILIKSPLLFFIIYLNKKTLFQNKTNNFLFRLYNLELVSTFVGFISPWGFRLSYFFLFSEALLCSNMLSFIKEEKRKMFMIGLIFYFIAFFMVEYFFVGLDGIFPYRFY